MSEPYKLEEELNLLDPKQIRFSLDEFRELTMEQNGEQKNVRPLRAFPLSAEENFIVLKDDNEKEIGTIRRIEDLEPHSQSVLRAELERAYFTPRILQINALEEDFHVPRWDVTTDRGPRVFEIRSSRRDIRVLSAGRVLIRDADGNRYEIPDYRSLDPASRSLVETLL